MCLPSNWAALDMVPLMVRVSGLNVSSRGRNTSSSRSRNLAAGARAAGADLLAAAGTCLGATTVGRRADPASLVVRLIWPPLPTLRVRLPICLLRTAAGATVGLAVATPVAAAKALLTALAAASFFLVVRTVFPRVVVVMMMRPFAVFFTSSCKKRI